MRTISSALLAHISGELMTLCMLFKITRRDGVVLTFTSLDQDIVFGGHTYASAAGANPSALQQTVGTGVDNMEIVGILTSSMITDADLRAGLYDGARFEVDLVNYADLTQGDLVLLNGWIGEITVSDVSYLAEVRSQMQLLSQQAGDLTSQTCRVKRLGDAECKYRAGSGGPETFSRTVAVVDTDGRIEFGSDTHPDGYYDYGMVTFTTGANIGLTREVKLHVHSANAVITLKEPFPFVVHVGDVATLEIGCNRTYPRCLQLSNTINFHGEPFVPGNQQYIQVGGRTT